MENYADIVKLHYEYYKSKKKRLGTSYKKHIPSNLKEIEKYSDIDSMVFENNNNNELIVAMRGLDFFGSPRDLMIGTEIALEDAYQQGGSDFDTSTKKKKGVSLFKNQYGEILIKEQSKIKELKKEYPNKKIVLAGHSRGGRKAIDLGEHNDLEYHAFQPAEMNRAATPFLTMGTNMLLGTIVPTDKIYKELVKSFMNRGDFFMGRAINSFIIEGYTPLQIQDKVVGSAIQSDSYGGSFRKLAEKIGIGLELRLGLGLGETQEQIETGYKLARLGREDKRQVTSKNSNIYKTENDRVSRGYQHTELVKPKQYVYNMFDHYLLGDHSINHFISEEMFNSVNENREIKEDVKIDNLEPIISPPPITQPSSAIGYTVNNRELCRKYGSVYNVHCNKLLR